MKEKNIFKLIYEKLDYLKKTKQYHSSVNTLNGLNFNKSIYYINFITISLGIIIFVFVLIIGNQLQKPITSSLFNGIPTGMILGYFIVEDQFLVYYNGLILAPLLNTLLVLLCYYLYTYQKFSAKLSLSLTILIWAIFTFLSFFILPSWYEKK
jgi:predicted membrane-bound dolichyl-phosphate-mannose-protein mannosyltransferase